MCQKGLDMSMVTTSVNITVHAERHLDISTKNLWQKEDGLVQWQQIYTALM